MGITHYTLVKLFGPESRGQEKGSDEKDSAHHAPREGHLSKTPAVFVYKLSFPRPVALRVHGPEVRKACAELLEHSSHIGCRPRIIHWENCECC
jgi:hypothetical protein